MNKFLLMNSYQEKLAQLKVSPRDAFVFSEWVRLFLHASDSLPDKPAGFSHQIDDFLNTQKHDFACTPREIQECARALRLLQQVELPQNQTYSFSA